MDKSWINDKKLSSSYVNGVKSFMNFANQNNKRPDKMLKCPCNVCNNTFYKNPQEVECDLCTNGFRKTYINWIYHGEKPPIEQNTENDTGNLDNDILESDYFPECGDLNELLDDMRAANHEINSHEEDTTGFRKLLDDAQRSLYPGCKTSVLSAVVKLLHLKVLGKWSNKSFTMLLEFIKSILPEGDILPSSLHGARKFLVEIGLGYEEIHACKNSCVLFWREHEKEDVCPICKTSRWSSIDGSKRVPHKKLRYFPLKPRLQRLFMCSKTAAKMRWHKEKRVEEKGISRHPADSLAWNHFNNEFPDFDKDSRNVRLGMASDGFTPWSNMGNSHSMWPVIVTVYNLPPMIACRPHIFSCLY